MTKLSDLMYMRGRRALITGATGYLGSVISDTLAELGADLVLVDKPKSNLLGLEKKLKDAWNINVISIECDLEIESERDLLAARVRSDGLGLCCLVNNAAFVGTSILQGWSVRFEDQCIETWRRAFEVNLTAVFHLCQSFLPELRKTKNGSIINISSIYGEFGPDWSMYAGTEMGNPAAYATSKGGVIQLTRWLSTTLAPDIRVNAIAPGGIYRNQNENFVKRYISRTPLKRMAVEDDFRGAVAFLASNLSNYVTGQCLKVDGGWSVW